MAGLAEIRGETLHLNLHEGQQRAWDSEKRIVAVIAGNQSGKTAFTPHWLYREIQRRGAGDYLYVTPTYPLLELKALPEFLRVFEGWLGLGSYRGNPSRQFVFSADGFTRTFGRAFDERVDVATRVLFGYATEPESLESATAKAAVLDEAGQGRFKVGAWEAVLRRVGLAQGRVLITTTPYNLGWLKREVYDRWRMGDPTIDVIQFESIMNPAFPRAEFEAARERLPAWKFNMFYRGWFERPAGMIYDCFDEGRHVVERFAIPEYWRRYVGIDFGGVHTAAVFLAEEPTTGRLYVYRIYKAGGRTAKGHVEALVRGEVKARLVVGGAAAEGQWREEFRAAGLMVNRPEQGDVEVGIDRVYGLLAGDKLAVFGDLRALIDELMGYSRVLDDNQEPTEQIEDKETYHLLDALRYIGGSVGYGARATVRMVTARGLWG
ncbi:MAG: terminase [Anaerolineales bacterium]|nr:terminase [Anaerolineales bacterium]